jgi:hypothetical protein
MSELADVYARMTEWARDLVDRNPKLQPLAGMLYRTNSYTLFINILRVQSDIEPCVQACKRYDDIGLEDEINRLINMMLLENNLERSEFDQSDINKFIQYLKLWIDVITFS